MACAAAGLLAACSGGGADAASATANSFFLDGTSVSDGQTWQINRPISFRFSQPIDFSTVNANTIYIGQPSGEPAVGEFQFDPSDPVQVVFVPRCPTELDLSDAGLLPGGLTYRIRISEQSTGAGSVLSTSGRGIEVAQTITFATPQSLEPIDLFIDTAPGPPTPLNGSYDAADQAIGTRLAFDDGSPSIPFELDQQGQGGLGDFLVPLNLYSELSSRTSVVVELNQAINPTAANVSPSRIQLQYREGVEWRPITTVVDLLANCTEGGATVRLRPVGILPQNRPVRVWLGPEFEDIVGDRNILPLDQFAVMNTTVVTDDGGAPAEFADEVLEEFLVGGAGSLQDTNAVSDSPSAQWGGGSLDAAFAFAGTGGPGGTFDWFIAPNTDFILDTTSTLILGGPGGTPVDSQLVVNGVLNVRDLEVPATSRLLIQGANPATFLISGELRVFGRISANGGNASPIVQPNQPNVPAMGAPGTAGGGAGGIGSFLTNQVTPRGGPGRGAFGGESGGGEGGESGWNQNSQLPAFRRAAGGGGGRFGADQFVFNTGLNADCYNQTVVGLDAESGFPGALEANAAERPGMLMPWGGMPGPGPFDADPGNDFWGSMLRDFSAEAPTLVTGELPTPWAGSGGGAGGDATRASAYPPSQLILNENNKGAGGGGGGGSLTILCLGDVILGPSGRIEANGGHGSGGENTAGNNRIGGGSGGGSGGHLIIQTGSQLDLSQVPANQIPILARGGQGGAGADNAGGATIGETGQGMDAVHVGVTGPGDMADNPWVPTGAPNCSAGVGVVRGAGGDGGPGVIQLHVSDLTSDILYAGGGGQSTIAGSVRPAPVGYDFPNLAWADQLIPQFGRFSEAQSKWIPLGGAAVDPEGSGLQSIALLFAGTDPADGRILTTAGVVDELPALLEPASPVEAPGLPEVSAEDPRVLLVDAAALVGEDAIYRRNPALLRQFALTVGAVEFAVESAALSEDGTTLALTVPGTGAALPAAGQVVLRPRYFQVVTSDLPDALPDSARVTISFQAALADPVTGEPDPESVLPAPGVWATDIATLNDSPMSPEYRFYRFRVEFEIGVGADDLSANTPRPSLDFLRLPFRF